MVIPHSLRMAVEGRQRLDLGVPPTADLGDVLQTLFRLYPKLAMHIPSENRPVRQHLNIFLSELGSRELAQRRALRDGQTVYLFASASKPPPLAPQGRKVPSG